MSEEERLARIDENRMGLQLHRAIKVGLENQPRWENTATWKANEAVIQEFEMRISQLEGKQSTEWQTIDRQFFIEVLPESDVKQHGLGDECWCEPTIENQGHGVPLITHNSLKEEL